MTDISAILGYVGTATGSILTATEIGKNLKQVFGGPEVDVTASKDLVIQLLDKLIDAKAAQLDIQEAVLALQRELRERDEFDAKAARYALQDTGRGAVVYVLKPDYGREEPTHCICPSCYAKRQASILQPWPERSNFLWCPACQATFLSVTRGDSGLAAIPSRWDNPYGG